MDTRFDTSPSTETVTTYSEIKSINGVSWGAILAGVFVALSVATILNLLGLGLDLLALGTHKGNLSHMGLASIVWVVLTTIVSMLAGGWVAGRMSGPSLASEGAMHGIVMCAVAIFITFVLAASSIGSFIGVMSTVIAQSTSTSEIVHQAANPTAMPMQQNTQNAMVDYQNQQQQQMKVNAEHAAKNLGILVLVFFVSFLLSAVASALGGIWGAASDREIFVRKQVKVKNY